MKADCFVFRHSPLPAPDLSSLAPPSTRSSYEAVLPFKRPREHFVPIATAQTVDKTRESVPATIFDKPKQKPRATLS